MFSNIFSYSKVLEQKEQLEQKHLHLLQILDSERQAKWHYVQQTEELTAEVKKLKTEVNLGADGIVLASEWNTPALFWCLKKSEPGEQCAFSSYLIGKCVQPSIISEVKCILTLYGLQIINYHWSTDLSWFGDPNTCMLVNMVQIHVCG